MTQRELAVRMADPIGMLELGWPEAASTIYDKQVEVVQSVERNVETVVVAGNQLGKDWIAGYVCVRAFFVHPVARIITTSVKDDHLRVLWGEIGRWLETSRIPLTVDRGGPFQVNHRDVRKVKAGGKQCPISYMRGMVSERGEGMAGHHAPYTLAVIDEASGSDQVVYTQMTTWAKRLLIFGNPNPVGPSHFFRQGAERGDLERGGPVRAS